MTGPLQRPRWRELLRPDGWRGWRQSRDHTAGLWPQNFSIIPAGGMWRTWNPKEA